VKNKLLNFTERLEEWVLAYTLLGIVLLSFIQVVLRYAFHYNFTWFEELGRYICVFLTFLGASIAVKTGAHFSMDAIVQSVPGRAAHLMKVVVNLACTLFFVIIVYYGTLHCMKLGRYGVKTAALRIPMFVPYLSIPVFSFIMSLRFLGKMIVHIRSFVNNQPFQH
jgi:C4-dicarboxylate transporter DctQ subunit